MSEAEFGSLSQRVAQRRREREARRNEPIILPVPGYGDLFAVRYRRIKLAEIADIVERHGTDADVSASIAMLVAACEDILEVTGVKDDGTPDYQSLGKKWSTRTIAELFEEDFPPETTVRVAMGVLDELELQRHAKAYIEKIVEFDKSEAEVLPGESRLSVES